MQGACRELLLLLGVMSVVKRLQGGGGGEDGLALGDESIASQPQPRASKHSALAVAVGSPLSFSPRPVAHADGRDAFADVAPEMQLHSSLASARGRGVYSKPVDHDGATRSIGRRSKSSPSVGFADDVQTEKFDADDSTPEQASPPPPPHRKSIERRLMFDVELTPTAADHVHSRGSSVFGRGGSRLLEMERVESRPIDADWEDLEAYGNGYASADGATFGSDPGIDGNVRLQPHLYGRTGSRSYSRSLENTNQYLYGSRTSSRHKHNHRYSDDLHVHLHDSELGSHAHDCHDHNPAHGLDHVHAHGHSHDHGHGGCSGHDHDSEGFLTLILPHGHSFRTHRGASRKLLMISLMLVLGVVVGELVGARISHSHALLLEALHAAMDSMSILLALVSSLVAAWMPSNRATFGYARVEVLTALFSMMCLFGMCVVVIVSAVQRLVAFQPETEVLGGVLSVTVTLGLVTNVAVTFILSYDADGNINVTAARAHAIADAAESFLVLVGGVIMWLRPSWWFIDPALSFVVMIAIFLANRAVVRESLDILMEFVPQGTDLERIRSEIQHIPGVREVEALHFWSVTAGKNVAIGVIKLFPEFASEASSHGASEDEDDYDPAARYYHSKIKAEGVGIGLGLDGNTGLTVPLTMSRTRSTVRRVRETGIKLQQLCILRIKAVLRRHGAHEVVVQVEYV
ncbi:Cadmium, cobalt and zinc/H(+)-K(+) antiporter [Porphyridium purpureum]|uniref:Cadmium, cobalt and zinc/H(+)-K(+) antiporter n=1 Tax=Porphyridium purpureum TaxID=35688 RepID=A0A5J4YMX7_PORPP|nr:Cadmium, cobalt and zinc/H(+)-K(+) antiporter [Porphyridium purpureum]|eukprot:POR9573..scf249_10